MFLHHTIFILAASTYFYSSSVFAFSACEQDFLSHPSTMLADERIDESSGLVASRRFSNLFWTHNDSGDIARIFGVSSDGETRAIATLTKKSKAFESIDIEDIAFGPCNLSKNGCIFLADTGDNDEERNEVYIYSFPEPELGETQVGNFQTTTIIYPDGAHNVEALLIAPDSTRVPTAYLIEKNEGATRIWRVPIAEGKTKAKDVGMFDVALIKKMGGEITGADISEDGTFLVIRTYQSVTLLCRNKNEPLVSVFNSPNYRILNVPKMTQGESVAIDRHSKIWLTSEDLPAPLLSLVPTPKSKRMLSCRCSTMSQSRVPMIAAFFLIGLFFVKKRFGKR